MANLVPQDGGELGLGVQVRQHPARYVDKSAGQGECVHARVVHHPEGPRQTRPLALGGQTLADLLHVASPGRIVIEPACGNQMSDRRRAPSGLFRFGDGRGGRLRGACLVAQAARTPTLIQNSETRIEDTSPEDTARLLQRSGAPWAPSIHYRMPFFQTNHERAALLILLLCVALVIALTPFATGLIGIPVLYVVFAPVHAWLRKYMGAQLAATLVVVLVVFVIVVPGLSFAGLVVNQAQQLGGGVLHNPLLGRLSSSHRDRGRRRPAREPGDRVVSWIGSSAFGLIGTATRLALNLTISLFGLFYLLLRPGETWAAVTPYIPFSPRTPRSYERASGM